MSARLVDIAAETGISPAAVSYVINGRTDKVSKAMRDKVLNAAARLGYRPNSSARAVRMGRHGALALIMSPGPHRSFLSQEMMLGITRSLAHNNLRLLVDYISDEQFTSEETLPRLLLERACDGMLLNYHSHIPPMLERLTEQFHLPTVWINTKNEFNSVYPDDFGAARAATEQLVSEGHRRIIYCDSAFNNATSTGDIHFSKLARRAGYEAAMEAAGFACEFVLDNPSQNFSRREIVSAYAEQIRAVFRRRRPAPPTAVVAYGSWELELLSRIPFELGLKVETLTFGLNASSLNDHFLRGLIVPMEEVGERAVAMLLRRIADPELRIPSESVPFRWADPAL